MQILRLLGFQRPPLHRPFEVIPIDLIIFVINEAMGSPVGLNSEVINLVTSSFLYIAQRDYHKLFQCKPEKYMPLFKQELRKIKKIKMPDIMNQLIFTAIT